MAAAILYADENMFVESTTRCRLRRDALPAMFASSGSLPKSKNNFLVQTKHLWQRRLQDQRPKKNHIFRNRVGPANPETPF